MEDFFCSDLSRSLQEDPIGTANSIETYILLEVSLPWSGKAWETAEIPIALRETIAEIKATHPKVKPLLIHQDQTRERDSRSLIIYQRPRDLLVNRFDRYEFALEQLEDAIEILQDFFAERLTHHSVQASQISSVQDVLICTHGSHDRCCARWGNPLYVKAQQQLEGLPGEIRIWRSSHLGGHRFAPTAVTFPDGRMYARLDEFSLKSILLRSGSLDGISYIYRGSTLLPSELQILERSLLLHFGWDWMKSAFKGEILQTPNSGTVAATLELPAQITFQMPGEMTMTCQAQLIPDEQKSVTLQASCNATTESTYSQYQIKQLKIFQVPYEVSIRNRT